MQTQAVDEVPVVEADADISAVNDSDAVQVVDGKWEPNELHWRGAVV